MNVARLKTRVLDTVRYLGNCQLTPDKRLYEELTQYIEGLTDESFQKDFDSINASCDLLKTITKTSADNDRKQSLMEEFKRESEILLRSLRIYTKVKQNLYTPLQILLKLELLFDPILDYNKISHDTYFELSKNISKTADEQLIESIVLIKNKNRPMLLRELTNALVDDIIIYLQKYNKIFDDFYNYDRITYVVFRLRNLSSRAERSTNVYNKLCFFIDSELKEKYKLDIETFIRLLLDQFENIDEGLYRKKLIDFVDNVYSQVYKIHKAENPESDMTSFYSSFDETPFTFVKFFDYIREDPVLTENDQSTFATLFEIYCKKLAGILPCAVSQPLPEIVVTGEFDDSESTDNAEHPRRNRRSRRNNATGKQRSRDFQDDDYADQSYSAVTTHGYSPEDYYIPEYTTNKFRYHEKRNYNDNSYTHQPRRRVNKQQTYIDENY